MGVVGLPCHRRPPVALRRPTRLATRDDRPDRERRRLREARLHARQPGPWVPQVPPPRHAVRDRAARAHPRHLADVPCRRRHEAARARAGVRRLPRAPVRPVHVHPIPRGPERAPRRDRLARWHRPRRDHRSGRRSRDGDALRARPRRGPHGRGRPDRVPGQVGQHRRPRALHRAEPAVLQRRSHARGGRLPVLRGLRRLRRQPRHEPQPPRTRRGRGRDPARVPGRPDDRRGRPDHGRGQVRVGPRRRRGRADRAHRRWPGEAPLLRPRRAVGAGARPRATKLAAAA